MKILFLFLGILLHNVFGSTFPKRTVPKENMNGEYLISNPNQAAEKPFSTLYSDRPNVEYFDAYSPPISTKYGEVFWTMMDPVPLDPDIVARFKDKTMAVVGYETDQVMKTPDGDVSVPITWAYNHHYCAYMSSSYSKMTELDVSSAGAYPKGYHNHGAPTFWMVVQDEDVEDPRPGSHVPISQFFSEGNGGEFRKSFHGYPAGMAQLIDSPNAFHIQPMQIDTKNRHYNGTDFKADILPKASQAPPNASYSGLLECPCTTRINKQYNITYSAQNQGSCDTIVDRPTECLQAAVKLDPSMVNAKMHVVDSENYPSGCSMIHFKNGSANVILNKHDSGAACGTGGNHWMGSLSSADSMVDFSADLDKATDTVTMNITGPDGKWFGVGIGAKSFTMSDKPYAVIVDGSGNVKEMKLGDHDGGQAISSSVKIVSNKVESGKRTIVLTRSFKGMTADHYTFDPTTDSTIPMIFASGTGADYAYHGAKQRGGANLQLSGIDAPTCICNSGVHGSLNGVPFSKNCLPEPQADLVQQKNPTCWVNTYVGGLACCHHQAVLLDEDQVQPEGELTYHMKFRFYFEPYEPETKTKPASHQNLIRLYYQTEAWAGEYDVPKADPTTPPEEAIHEITARWKVKDMLQECDTRKGNECSGNITNYDGINLIYAGGHCHAPSCISMELYNADTGKLLCRHDPVYGKSHQVFDELGYLALPPCVWGPEEEGLIPPMFLSYESNLISIKRNNNTYGHYGEMASWQMRGILVKNNDQ